MAAATLLAAIGVLGYWHLNRPWIQLRPASQPPTPFERAGQDLHDALGRGEARLALRSQDEGALWRWLAAQGAPVTSSVVSREGEDRIRVVPVGAAVYTLDRARTSVVAYRIDGRAVTLALAAADDVPDAPAARWWSKRVVHRRDAAGRNTLTWTIGGGTYVMVTELAGAGQRACVICHTSERFRRRLDTLDAAP